MVVGELVGRADTLIYTLQCSQFDFASSIHACERCRDLLTLFWIGPSPTADNLQTCSALI